MAARKKLRPTVGPGSHGRARRELHLTPYARATAAPMHERAQESSSAPYRLWCALPLLWFVLGQS